MIHHVTLEVSDLERSAAFYDAVFGALGWRRHTASGRGIGWGIAKPVFFVVENGDAKPGSETVCLTAAGIAGVKVAWERGTITGGDDDGAPGQRPELGPSYYSAYLRDPDGYRLEIAVE